MADLLTPPTISDNLPLVLAHPPARDGEAFPLCTSAPRLTYM